MSYIGSKINSWREYYLYLFFIGMVIRAINFYSLLPQTFDSIFFRILGILGILLLLLDVFVNIRGRNFPYNILLSLYIVILVITTFVNRQYGMSENLKTIMWAVLQYFVIYQFAFDNPNNEVFFNRISLSFIYSWFVLSLSSMVLFFSKFGYEKYYDARHRIRVGFLESRLFGVYSDINNGAIAALAVIVLSLFFLYHKRVRGVSKAILMCSLPLQFIYIVLSGSRSTYLISIAVLFIAIFIIMIKKKNIDNYFYRFLKASFYSILSITMLIGIYNGTKWGFQEILPHLKGINLDKSTANFSGNEVNVNNFPNDSLVRKDVAENADVSNARLTIWKSAFDLFKTNMVIGISPKNLVTYAQEVLPNGYIAKVGIAIHNAYLNILTSTGILGFITFFSFLLRSFILNIRKISKKSFQVSNYRFFYCLILLMYALYACLNNELVYENTVGTFIFWLFLGRVNSANNID